MSQDHSTSPLDGHEVVDREAWIEARKNLLQREKQFTRERDELTRLRQALPWVRVNKSYSFHGPDGDVTLGDLFGDKSQLIVMHFMFGEDWEEACKSCSFWADGYSGYIEHIQARDAAFVVISKAPLDKLEAFKARMGWRFDWYSAQSTDFNEDFHVTFSQEQIAGGEGYYNFQKQRVQEQMPGMSVFIKGADGDIYHTYSAYSRGLDILNGAYHFIDTLPKGRNESELPWPMAWLKHRDRY